MRETKQVDVYLTKGSDHSRVIDTLKMLRDSGLLESLHQEYSQETKQVHLEFAYTE